MVRLTGLTLPTSSRSPRYGTPRINDAVASEREPCLSDEEEFTNRTGEPQCTDAAVVTLLRQLRLERKSFFLESTSVYGAGILMPQLARTAGWPRMLCYHTIKTYFYVLLNYFIQATILLALAKEQNVMDLFAGEPYLCDFGSPIDRCPDSPTCLGPGGTKVSAQRLYDFDVWSTRKYVKDAFKQLFPDRELEIESSIDPGEYGAESQHIRWLCCLIFMIEVMSELALIVNMAFLIFAVPSAPEPWFVESSDHHSPAGEADENVKIRVRIAGMPQKWKIINFVVMLFPKILMWEITAEVGVTYLMETSDIQDMIVNSIALAFVLQVDETICTHLMSQTIMTMLAECEAYELVGQDSSSRIWEGLAVLIPSRLLIAACFTALFIVQYYWQRCSYMSDGNWWISKDVYLPKSSDYSILNFFLPYFFPVQYEDTIMWTQK